ncbi:MAG: hypothetical protein ACREOV_11790, partial [Candidatus Dormibacteraceae bacterium]
MAPRRSQSRQKALRQGGAMPRPAAANGSTATGRAPARRPSSRSYRAPRRSFWRGPYPDLGILAVAVIVVIVVVHVAHPNTGSE